MAESVPGETRVAATPPTVRQLLGLGHQVVVESGAGAASGVGDRSIDWGRAGTITAVVAALAGLLLTGVSTLYDALVSQGELEQSRQAADQETRAQALRVAYWTEFLAPFVKRVHVINSSSDPVSEADLLLSPAEAGPHHVLQLPVLAPCSETVIKEEIWAGRPGQGPPYAPGDRPPGVVRWMAFRDRDGLVWKRDSRGLSRVPPPCRCTAVRVTDPPRASADRRLTVPCQSTRRPWPIAGPVEHGLNLVKLPDSCPLRLGALPRSGAWIPSRRFSL